MSATAPKTFDPIQIKQSIDLAWQRYITEEEGRQPSNRPYSYAGSYEDCVRKLTLYMTDGDKLPPFDASVLAKFHRGNDRARNLKIDLERAGQYCNPRFTLVGQEERFEIKNRKGQVVIAGKYDCRMQFSHFTKPVVEIKDWSENITARIETFEDCFNNTWTKKGAFQILMYLLGSGEPFGFLLLGKSGLPLLIPVILEEYLEQAESFLAKAEIAFSAAQSGELPPYHDDATECARCPFMGGICSPPISTGPGVKILDGEWEPKLERREELKEAHKEYEAIDKDLKDSLRGLESGVIGHFVLSGVWGKKTGYNLPEDVKAKYKVTDPKGKFTLTVERMP